MIAVSAILLHSIAISIAFSDECRLAEDFPVLQRRGELEFDAKIAANMAQHKTDKYRSYVRDGPSSIIARRGHSIEVVVRYRKHGCVGSPIFLMQDLNRDSPVWMWTDDEYDEMGAKNYFVYSARGHCFLLLIPPHLPVGDYEVMVQHSCSQNKLPERLVHVEVIFDVQKSARSGVDKRETLDGLQDFEQNEYLYNDMGYLWVGDIAIRWDYAVRSPAVQMARNVIETAMNESERSDPVFYARALTRLLGDPLTPQRVLQGRWDGMYGNGVEPWQWTSSAQIFQRWLQTKDTVKYGQCWVFGALLTSLLRSKGIPARTVTNYRSHHDRGLTDNQQSVLRQYDKIQQPDESVWNFHVWSEAWLARSDLNPNVPANWNALDATPQEPSPLAPGNHYQSGPAYVPYVKQNFVFDVNYDTIFVTAEVNSLRWCPVNRAYVAGQVGIDIVTKMPGQDPGEYVYNNPLLITGNYKQVSRKRSTNSNIRLPPPYSGCRRVNGLRLSASPEVPSVGQTFNIIVDLGNSTVPQNSAFVLMEPIVYTSQSLGIVKVFQRSLNISVAEAEYLPYLQNTTIFRFKAGVYNSSGQFVFHDALLLRLVYDSLSIEVTRGTSNDSVDFLVTVSYNNPLSIPLTGVLLSVFAPSFNVSTEHLPDIPPAKSISYNVTVGCGSTTGTRFILATLNTAETFKSVRGYANVDCTLASGTMANGPAAMTFLH
ncbi:protein-glutamine gamma-glutamyltransferase 4-like [Corticium candelabrum]|uniref:protein-glutamine gamma-glutamyltransferase 4-like n=1 Tax=Corticium candelabrum TaxID=121492 RepID=UPI002E36605A|nr:protein-glutamine gamma-glutamyltransferase 4-like [Corticium candelabrum]